MCQQCWGPGLDEDERERAVPTWLVTLVMLAIVAVLGAIAWVS